MSNTRYDPEIIQVFADKLYKEARSIVFRWTFLGLFAGGGVGAMIGASVSPNRFSLAPALLGAVFIGLIGWSAGNSRAFLIRSQAQVALCQRQIEENTRR